MHAHGHSPLGPHLPVPALACLQLKSLVEDSLVSSNTLKKRGTPFMEAATRMAARDLVCASTNCAQGLTCTRGSLRVRLFCTRGSHCARPQCIQSPSHM